MAEDSNCEVVDIEILQKQNSLLSEAQVISLTENWLHFHSSQLFEDVITKFDNDQLSEHVSSITIQNRNAIAVNGNFYKFCHYVYRFNSYAPEIQEAEGEHQISTQWLLPTEDFHGLWEALIYDNEIKNELLNYVSTALHFTDRNVDPNVISWNRIVLLHGPPGTGKTTLCKALAQKICIRFSSKFQYGHFVEVNTHSLFSKWFSESGKLVTKMFLDILALLEDPKVLVIVLLDEVESLARSRASALHGNEPSDALRVVNALLTHLDMIKRYPNVLILTTSNITEAIDVALIDRADIKQFVGLPSVDAIYQIYCSGIKELIKAEIILTGDYRQSSWLSYNLKALDEAMEKLRMTSNMEKLVARTTKLRAISEQSVGLSGRSLRKIPFIACSLFIKGTLVTVEDFLEALLKAVEKHWNDVKTLKIHI